MNKIIEIKNLSYQKEKNKILTDISFDVEAGDFLGIIGRACIHDNDFIGNIPDAREAARKHSGLIFNDHA